MITRSQEWRYKGDSTSKSLLSPQGEPQLGGHVLLVLHSLELSWNGAQERGRSWIPPCFLPSPVAPGCTGAWSLTAMAPEWTCRGQCLAGLQNHLVPVSQLLGSSLFLLAEGTSDGKQLFFCRLGHILSPLLNMIPYVYFSVILLNVILQNCLSFIYRLIINSKVLEGCNGLLFFYIPLVLCIS